MIDTAVGIKKEIVEKDPFEKGDRALLNLGHTIGHAIESYYNGKYLHGECVALGCFAAAYISLKMNLISVEECYEIRDMFVPFNLPISIETDDIEPIISAAYNDKKNTKGSVTMVLLDGIGKARLVKNIDQKLIRDALNELNFKEED
jgi:3-dehydroquinate synthase